MAQTWGIPINSSDSVSSSRTVINNAFDALQTNFSGTAEPSDNEPYQWWADTTNTLLKMRNSGDTDWLEIGTLAANLGHLRIDGSNAMTGTLDLDDQRVDFDADNDTSLRASADDTLTLEIGGTDEWTITAAKLDLGLVNDYVIDLGKSGDTNNARIDFDADGDTSITASADDTLNVEIGGDADFVVINSNGIICTAGELRSGGDNGGGSGLTTLTNATAAKDSTSATLGETPTGIAAENAAWIKVYIGTTAAYVPYWTA